MFAYITIGVDYVIVQVLLQNADTIISEDVCNASVILSAEDRNAILEYFDDNYF